MYVLKNKKACWLKLEVNSQRKEKLNIVYPQNCDNTLLQNQTNIAKIDEL